MENYETCKRLQQATQSMDLPKGVTYVPILVAPEGVRLVSLDKLKKMVASAWSANRRRRREDFLGGTMSTCYSVIARETLVFPPRWKRHLIENGVCKRCLQPEFVKQKVGRIPEQ